MPAPAAGNFTFDVEVIGTNALTTTGARVFLVSGLDAANRWNGSGNR